MSVVTIYRHFEKAWTETLHETLSDAQLRSIAGNCRRDEIAAIHFVIKLCNSGLAACPDWDVEMQYLLHKDIYTLQRLLAQIDLLRNQ
ncbi:hypothetical protein WKH27_12245 [Pantoea agglomerans]|uniref:hypothetical protein n=1 Tax=Enterobacter agglomerans TaxID=549 RepID=UPI00289E1270|nr:hypothetical protein [Pantoea agglomerans]WNK37630.1 hypothetical protein RM158_20545 [Pantoea agglomerans]WNK55806.1 hypothetical protein RM154_20075 [Pantoea agglomerans]